MDIISAGGGGKSDEEIQDIVGNMFTGNSESGIDATYDDTNGKIDLNVTASGSGHVIQDDGVPFTQRTNLDFVGPGVTVIDDPGNDASQIYVPGLLDLFDDTEGNPAEVVPTTPSDGTSTFAARRDHQHNLEETYARLFIMGTDPTVNDDIDAGYLVGDIWVDTDSPSVWQCADNTDGAAVWLYMYWSEPALESAVIGFVVSGVQTGIIVEDNGAGGIDFTVTTPPGHVIQNDGTPFTQRTNLNFGGAGVSVLDGPGADETVVNIPGLTDLFDDAEGNPADVTTGSADDGISDFAARRDHVHHSAASLDTEAVQDLIGDMFTGNTETGIDATYDDTNGKINLDAQTAGDARYAPIAKGVTNGDSHDHVGGDGAQIDHGGMAGLADDDHAQYHNDARGDARYAPIAKGVTNGDSHDHVGGDGGTIDYSSLSGTPTIPDTEAIQDIVGAMFSGNTETFIAATYDDSGGKINLDSTNLKDQINSGSSIPDYIYSGMEFPLVDGGVSLKKADWSIIVNTLAISLMGTTGWFPRSETWTRTGDHTFTVAGDLTTVFRSATKIRYKDGGAYEYAVVDTSSHSAGTTTVNLVVNSDYAMAAVTITDKYVSYIQNPEGFPNSLPWTQVIPGTEIIQDIIGAMFSGNTETGITATYDDTGGKIDLVVTGGASQEDIEDYVGGMVTGNTETGIAVTYDDAGGKLNFDAQTAGDARYAPIAKGVTNGDSHDHVGGDGGTVAYTSISGRVTTSRQAVLMHGISGTVGAGADLYLVPALNGLVALNATPIPFACTVKNMYVRTNNTQSGTGSLVATLQKEVANTSVVVTVAAGAGAGTYSDTSNSSSFNAGDRLAIKFHNNASVASCQITGVSVELQITLL